MKRLTQRKLPLDKISKCHPSKTKKITNRCLPKSFYKLMNKKYKTKKSYSIFHQVGCNDNEEHCLLDKVSLNDNLKKQLRTEYLRPRRPKAWDKVPDTWLDNFNIIHVMQQYEKAFRWFKFLGVFPIDFSAPNPYRKNEQLQCLYKETCNLNLKNEYNNGKRGIGMVFNLDPPLLAILILMDIKLLNLLNDL